MNDSVSLDSDLLRTFLTVVRYGNVTRAAQSLHRTQSAVSVQIKRLEENLNASLFHRNARGVSLTEAGERLCRSAERIVNDLDQTVSSFRADPVGGQLRVGIPDEYGSRILPLILADFAARFPAVEVFVQCGFSVTFPQAIARGDLDLALFADSDKNQWSDAVFIEKLVWAASRNYQTDTQEPVPLAVFDRACEWRDIATDALKAVKTPCRIVLSSESVTGIMASISTGLAVGVIAESTLQPGMKILDHRDGFPALPNSVLRLLKGPEESPAINAMEDAITRGFRNNPSKTA